jgi:hypothetical protein
MPIDNNAGQMQPNVNLSSISTAVFTMSFQSGIRLFASAFCGQRSK